MPLWRDDIWADIWSDETEQLSAKRSDPCPDKSGDKSPYCEHKFGVFEQLKINSVEKIFFLNWEIILKTTTRKIRSDQTCLVGRETGLDFSSLLAIEL